MTALRHVVFVFLCYIAVIHELALARSQRQTFAVRHHSAAGCSYNIGSCPHHMLCIDDGLFGVCRASSGLDGDEVYYFHLTKVQDKQSKMVVDRLKKLGLNLSGPYSQCVLSSIMFSYQYGLSLDLSICDYILMSPTSTGSGSDVTQTPAHIIQTDYVKFERELYDVINENKKPMYHDLPFIEQSPSTATLPVAMTKNGSISVVENQPSLWTKYAVVVYTITGIIIGVAIGSVVIYIVCRRKKKLKDNVDGQLTRVIKLIPGYVSKYKLSPQQTPSWLEDQPPVYVLEPSTAYKLLEYIDDIANGKGQKLQEYWQLLCRYQPDSQATCNAAITAVNMNKNRYTDVTLLPYDHTRVILNADNNVQKSDYINASTITDHDPQLPLYIVTQCPLDHTRADFWQMIWEQQCTKIVDLTTAEESSLQSYWPRQQDKALECHLLEVRLLGEYTWCQDYVVRVFRVTDRQTLSMLIVSQFHFIHWPEDSVPLGPKQLLAFRRKLKRSYSGQACPTVVLCSDGVGRSGTYCLIDLVLSRLSKGAKEIDVVAAAEHLRDQRQSVIRTKEQFEFAFTAIMQDLHDSIGG